MSDPKLNIPYSDDPVPKAAPKLLSPEELGVIMPQEGMSGVRQSYKFNDFNFVPKPNMDNYLYRAQRQKWYSELGLTLGNLLPNIALGIVEGAGYIGTMFETGNDRDYSNALTELAQKYKNPWGEVYREDPSKLIDWKDSAWWFNTGGQLVESIGEFAALGMGTASIFGKLAEAAAWSARSLKVGRGVAQVLNAGLLSYVEGAMSGQQIYQQTYQTQYDEALRNGASHTEAAESAKEIASQAAARTVQLNTLMNTGLNLTILGPMFRGEENAMMKWFRNNKQQPGESLAEYKARLQAAVTTDPAMKSQLGLRHAYMATVGEPLQEGIEEVNTQYAEQASKKAGKQSLFDALTDFEGYLNAVTNQEGALNFALGALGGLGHVAVIDNAPIHHKNISGFNLEGKPVNAEGQTTEKKRWVSARTLNEYNTRSYFNNVKDALLKDIEWFETKNKEMLAAKESKDTALEEKIRAEMIAVNHFNAVSMGLAENWKEQYRQIAALDNTKTLDEPVKKQLEELESQLAEATQQGDEETVAALTEAKKELLKASLDLQGTTEAMKQGYAEHIGDTRYQQRAQEAIQDLDYLQSTFNDLQAMYNTGNQEDGDLVDHLFMRKANHYLVGKSIEKQEAELQRMKASWGNQQTVSGLKAQITEHAAKLEDLERVRKTLEADIAALNSKDEKYIKKLLDTYKVTWLPGEDASVPAKRLVSALEGRIAEYNKRAQEEKSRMDDAVLLWKQENPDATEQDMQDRLRSYDTSLMGFVELKQAQLDQVKREQEIAGEFLAEMTRKPNLESFRKAAKKDREAVTKDYRDALKKASDTILKDQLDKEAAAELMRKIDHETQQASHEKSIREQQAYLRQRLKDSVAALKIERNKVRKKELQDHIAVLRAIIASLDAQLAPAPAVEQKISADTAVKEILETKPASKPAVMYNQVPKDQHYGVLVAHLGTEGATEWSAFLKRNSQAPFDQIVKAFRTAYEQLTGKPIADNVLDGFFIPFLKDEVNRYKNTPVSAAETYTELRNMMPKEVQGLLDEYELSTEVFDAARLLSQLKGLVNPETALSLVTTLRNMLTERGDIPAEGGVSEEPKLPPAPVTVEDQGNTVNYTLLGSDSEVASDLHKNHTGKTVRDAMKVGYNSTPYDELQFGTNYGYLRFYDVLDENFNKSNLVPGIIVPGTKIHFEVDTQWNGKVNIDNALVADEFGTPVKRVDSFLQYTDSAGKIPTQPSTTHPEGAYADVPIKIVASASGQTLGYLHRVSWVNSKYPGSNTYQHVVDSYQEGEDLITNNVAAQTRRLKAVRKAIVDAFNANSKLPIQSTVTERTSGSLFINLEVNKATEKSKIVRGVASNLLPDTNIQIAYVAGTPGAVDVKTGANSSFAGTIVNMKQVANQFAGVPVTLLPTPNGYIAAPLFNKKLGDIPVAINTMISAIEIYLSQNKEKAAEVLKKSKTADHQGFDLLTHEGLRNFINQFYMTTTKVTSSKTLASPTEAGAVERFMLDIEAPFQGETVGRIKVGETYSGVEPTVLKLDGSGKLMADQAEYLKGKLSSQYFVVPYSRGSIQGLNHPGSLAEIQIKRDGTVTRTEHANFNAYLKSKSETYVYGKHQVNGTYVYTANPGIYFNYAEVFAKAPATPPATNQAAVDEDTDFFAGMRNGVLTYAESESVQQTAVPEKGENLSRELLEKLSNFTPEEHHNGKTVETAFQELLDAGIGRLAEGHNPFYKC